MKNSLGLLFFLSFLSVVVWGRDAEKEAAVERMVLVNDYFMARWPVAGDSILVHGRRPSNIWTRSVYMEGLLALNEVAPEERYVDYAMNWAVAHMWGFRGGNYTRNANDQCCAQVYVDLYRMHGDSQVLEKTERMLRNVMDGAERADWWWVDALQMAMPVYAKMGEVKRDVRYFRTMMGLYKYTRDEAGRVGLFNPVDGLWWRDADFLPPYKEPNGENCYWSRGNGWAFAALARSMDEIRRAEFSLPSADRAELADIRRQLESDFLAMAYALKNCQRPDGFWNSSLADELHYGGPETTGTALFVYGLAWGIRNGLLSDKVFGRVVAIAWEGLAREAVHPDGFLGYVQPTGKEPSDGQPVGYDSQPDFDDFGVGCFLLAGAEMVKLLSK